MATVKVLVDGVEEEMAVTRQGDALRVARGDDTAVLHLIARDGPAFLLEQEMADGSRRRIRVAGHSSGEARQLWVNGRSFTYQRLRRGDAAAAAAAGSLSASIPAVVSQVLVEPGDVVAEGDKLILLESMKMVIPIQAPHDGRVTAVHCADGDSVPAGEPLVEVEQTDAAS